MTLNEAETRLCTRAASAKPIKFGRSRRIRARVLKRLALRLPINGKVTELAATGLTLVNATIDGRLDLTDARREDGALPALDFRNCVFIGGFVGAHGHFGRLGFMECRFFDPATSKDARPLPTIDLTGASVESDLVMRSLRPARARDFLWIRAIGLRVDGELDLTASKLRAPAENKDRRLFDPIVAALNLTRADIHGDFQFLGGATSDGSIRARGAHIRGDVWMSGATIDYPEGDAIFFQATTVDGLIMLDSRPDRADRKGDTRLFKCFGGLNLTAAEVGRDLELRNSVIRGPAKLFDLQVKNDFRFGAHVEQSITLEGCRIGGSLLLSDLTMGEEAESLSLENGHIGRSLELVRPALTERPIHIMLAARRTSLVSLPQLELVETLWNYQHESGERELAQVGFLLGRDVVYQLDGHDAVLNAAIARFGHAIDNQAAALEYLRIYCTYVQGAEGASPVVDGNDVEQRPPFLEIERPRARKTSAGFGGSLSKVKTGGEMPTFTVEACVLYDTNLHRRQYSVTATTDRAIAIALVKDESLSPKLSGMPRFDGPLIRHPRTADGAETVPATEAKWVTAPTLAGLQPDEPRAMERDRERLTRNMFSSVSLRGTVVLDNLFCDMLNDQAGSFWGRDVRMEINHFVYNRTTWEGDSVETRTGALSGLWAAFKRASAGVVVKLLTLMAERVGQASRLPSVELRTPWQTKLDWIYQQFDTSALAKPRRYAIKSHEYRPQPFEQAVKVARAEGREDYAIHFEIAKRNIEWRLFTRRHRGRFVVLGLSAAFLWPLLADQTFTLETAVTAAVLFVVFTFISDIFHLCMRGLFGHLRRPIRAIATLVGAFLIGWAGVDAANDRGMLVIDVEPVASLVREDPDVVVIGSQRSSKKEDVANNVPCRDTINEALYALDVLVPLIDLREENRCEVGDASAPGRTYERDDLLGLFESWPKSHTDFWDVLKALYAVAGWFIVSLSILTFANITRSRTEP